MKAKLVFALLTAFTASVAQPDLGQWYYGGDTNTYAKGMMTYNRGAAITGGKWLGRVHAVTLSHPDLAGRLSNPDNFLRAYKLGMFGLGEGDAIGIAVCKGEYQGMQGFGVVGTIKESFTGYDGMFFMFVDQYGSLIDCFPLTYPGYMDPVPRSVIYNAFRNSFVFTGDLAVDGASARDIFLCEMDANGNFSTHVYGFENIGASNDMAYDILQDPYSTSSNNHSYYIVGSSDDVNGMLGGLVIHVDLQNFVFTPRWYGNQQNTLPDLFEFYSVEYSLESDGLLIGGRYYNGNDNNMACFMLNKSNLAVQWARFFDYAPAPGADNVCIQAIEARLANSVQIYLAGNVTSQGFYGGDDIQMIILDSNGNPLVNGDYTYGQSFDDHASGISFVSPNLHIMGESFDSTAQVWKHYMLNLTERGSFNRGLANFSNCKKRTRPAIELAASYIDANIEHLSQMIEHNPVPVVNKRTILYRPFFVCGDDFEDEDGGNDDHERLKATGIGENEQDKSLLVFPNPFSDRLQISNRNGMIKSLNIYSQTGQLITTANGGEEIITLETSAWSGLYFIQVTYSDNDRQSFRIIK